MALGVAVFILAIVIIAVYLIIELKRFRHKIFAIFLILLILFIYFSVASVFNGRDVDYKSVSGLINAFKIYWAWLVSAFGNLKTITTNAIKMNWGGR